jgi:hypothetical protein
MAIRVVLATAVAAAIGAAGVSVGAAMPTVLVRCGAVTAAGWKFQVGQARLGSCASAKTLTKKLASGVPKSRGYHHYPGTYLGMRCFASSTGKAAEIQCTSGDGKKALYAVARR